MKEKDIYNEISSIKKMMERSTRFISLSGLSGVLSGIYAIIGAALAYQLIEKSQGIIKSPAQYSELVIQLLLIGVTVLILSVATCIWLTSRNANRKGQSVWNESSKSLLKSSSLPLLTGGCLLLILLSQGYYGIIAPVCLIFYGLSLVAGSQFTYGDIKWLGICEIALGLLSTLMPNLGLVFWTMGFGVLHIVYGILMHLKYDRENSIEKL